MNILLAAILLLNPQIQPATINFNSRTIDTEPDSTYIIRDAVVTESLKESSDLRQSPLSSTSISLYKIEKERISSPKELSLITPNFYIPDYGSKMTSSIYVRGLGARIDQPAIGLYVDNIPYLNKSNFDIEFFDIRKVDILRGPQGTLYGRNTIGGVMNIHTLSPFVYQGFKASADYGSWNTFNVKAALYFKHNGKNGRTSGYSVSAYYKRSDGAYTNTYNNENCDTYNGGGARARMIWHLNDKWEMEHSVSADMIKQKGYAYSQYDTISRKALPINYNDPCNYRRFTLTNGYKLQYLNQKIRFSSITSWQYTDDKMVLDQDFTDKSMFTLLQSQKEHAFTQDFVIASNRENSNLKWIAGVFGFHKNNRMNAPVNFGQDGIDNLILKGANAGIHTVMPFANLVLRDNILPLNTNFTMPTTGAALYGQLSYKLGEGKNYWLFTGGLRLDYEHASMTYRSNSSLAYKITPIMPAYKEVEVTMDGVKRLNFTEFLPKVSIMRTFSLGNIYASVAKGYKAGGFNTQIFSDILQTKLMGTLKPNTGGTSSATETTDNDEAAKTTYKPEYSWNFEVGSHITAFENKVTADASIFYIVCKNQQITVFPDGQSTGRMMSNAGKSKSCGAELSLMYTPVENIRFNASYGYTNAKFKEYNDGNNDYSDKYVPYAPKNTLYIGAEYSLPLKSGDNKLFFHIDWSGAGKIYWDEANKYYQPFYNTLGANISLTIGKFTMSLFGRNLTDSKYNTFYFKSVGNSFVQICKPRMIGASLSIEL